MYESDKKMVLSPEDLIMTIAFFVLFILAFTDIRSPDTIAFASFPASVILLISWFIVRFRRRPLPKQVQYRRLIHLSTVKIIRNYHIFAVAIGYLLVLFRYPTYQDDYFLVSLIYNFVAVFFLSILDFIGHILVNDNLEILIKMEDEEEQIFKKKRFNLLFGTRFYIIISVFTILSLGMSYFSVASIILTFNLGLIFFQLGALFLGIGLFYFTYRKTMNFKEIKEPSLILKAVDYYESADLTDESFKLLENYLDKDPNNIAMLSRIAVIHTKVGNYDKVLEYSEKVLAEVEEKQLTVPHMTARAHLLKSISLNAKEQYQEAYDEVLKSLKIIPENNAARKLRRDLRRKLKATD